MKENSLANVFVVSSVFLSVVRSRAFWYDLDAIPHVRTPELEQDSDLNSELKKTRKSIQKMLTLHILNFSTINIQKFDRIRTKKLYPVPARIRCCDKEKINRISCDRITEDHIYIYIYMYHGLLSVHIDFM